MKDENYNPTELTARRAAELWKRMLRNPKFDNGDNGPTGGMASILASMIPTNTTEELLDAFAEKLAQRIVTPSERDREYFDGNTLSVDYGPCKILADCAAAVGLKVQFPWKTNMWIHGDQVSVCCGYHADTVIHYALPNGKWLVTTLRGTEIDKIKAFVVDGVVPEFRVEE